MSVNLSGVSLKTLSSSSTPAAPLGSPRWLMFLMFELFACGLQGFDLCFLPGGSSHCQRLHALHRSHLQTGV